MDFKINSKLNPKFVYESKPLKIKQKDIEKSKNTPFKKYFYDFKQDGNFREVIIGQPRFAAKGDSTLLKANIYDTGRNYGDKCSEKSDIINLNPLGIVEIDNGNYSDGNQYKDIVSVDSETSQQFLDIFIDPEAKIKGIDNGKEYLEPLWFTQEIANSSCEKKRDIKPPLLKQKATIKPIGDSQPGPSNLTGVLSSAESSCLDLLGITESEYNKIKQDKLEKSYDKEQTISKEELLKPLIKKPSDLLKLDNFLTQEIRNSKSKNLSDKFQESIEETRLYPIENIIFDQETSLKYEDLSSKDRKLLESKLKYYPKEGHEKFKEEYTKHLANGNLPNTFPILLEEKDIDFISEKVNDPLEALYPVSDPLTTEETNKIISDARKNKVNMFKLNKEDNQVTKLCTKDLSLEREKIWQDLVRNSVDGKPIITSWISNYFSSLFSIPLEDLPYRILPVPGDGDCFIHVFLLAITGNINGETNTQDSYDNNSNKSANLNIKAIRDLIATFFPVEKFISEKQFYENLTGEQLNQLRVLRNKAVKLVEEFDSKTFSTVKERSNFEKKLEKDLLEILDIQSRVKKESSKLLSQLTGQAETFNQISKYNTFQEYKEDYIKSSNYFLDSTAIQIIEKHFNVKFIIFDQTNYKKLLDGFVNAGGQVYTDALGPIACVSNNEQLLDLEIIEKISDGRIINTDNFDPPCFIMINWVGDLHFELVEYDLKRVFSWKTLPLEVKMVLKLKCENDKSSLWSFITKLPSLEIFSKPEDINLQREKPLQDL